MVHFGDFMSCLDVSRTRAHALVRRGGEWLVVLAIVVFHTYATQADAPRPVRVMSLPPASDLSAADASRRLSAARDNGIDTVFVPMSIYGADGGPDAAAIDVVIRTAHERGLRVHASLRIIAAVPPGPLPASRDHVVYRHPEWLMVPREMALELQTADPRSPDYLGRLARWTRAHSDRVDGIYVSPLQPDAASHIVDAVRRLVSRYAVDGLHLDGVRFPGRDFDYGVRSLDMFRSSMRRVLPAGERLRIDTVAAIDPFGYPEELPDAWQRFRTTQLTSLIAQLRTAVAAARPDVIVSAAAVPGADIALTDHLQDWRTWLDNGFVDALTGDSATTTTLLYSYEALVDPPADRTHAAAAPTAGSASP
jgi:uncharacterized lipoprotein YddW (UPF0748 family)